MANLHQNLTTIFYIMKYCEKIKNIAMVFENDFSKFVLKENFPQCNMCAFYVFQIGELFDEMSDNFKKNVNKYIPWEKINGVKCKIEQDYDNFDFELIWTVMTQNIDRLYNSCRNILEVEYPDYIKKLEEEFNSL